MSDIDNEQINPILVEFLDADSFEDKYKLLVATPTLDFDDLLIDNMASSIDVVIGDGDIESRLQDLKNCVRTRAKYEQARYRR
ncbi:MAG: hypothetical protein K6D38_08300 [Pseudobutyrivibrio sp.]|nr:hypothetical protein [Pseudobutyrivibrio sp.]